MPAATITRSMDARDVPSPGPLMSMVAAVKDCAIGDVIEVRSNDRDSWSEIRPWVARSRHELVGIVAEDGYTRFIVRKAS
jgi:TusA-related sulfurtransferase